MLEERLNQDLKSALLRGDKRTATVLRGLKSAILYLQVEQGNRGVHLSDEQLVAIFKKEAKKREESAGLYRRGGSEDKAQSEIDEKHIIEQYLPKQLDEQQLSSIIDDVVSKLAESGNVQMGPAIAEVKKRTAGTADGSAIANLVKRKLGL